MDEDPTPKYEEPEKMQTGSMRTPDAITRLELMVRSHVIEEGSVVFWEKHGKSRGGKHERRLFEILF